MTQSFGGFFGLEANGHGKGCFHPHAKLLNTGRACFYLILQKINPVNVYVPYYACDSLLSPLQELKIPYTFYPLTSQLEPEHPPASLGNKQLFVYINYFGGKTNTVRELVKRYGSGLVVDNTQAFFEKDAVGYFAFNSARKFFGVPDGAYLYSPLDLHCPSSRNASYSLDHLLIRSRDLARAFKLFQEYEKLLNNNVLLASDFTLNKLATIDYGQVVDARNRNFATYHLLLKEYNMMPETVLDVCSAPFCYPLLLKHKVNKAELFARNIFVPTLWSEVLERNRSGFEFEKILAERLLPLPLDHRYSSTDVEFVAKTILKHILC